MGEKTELHEYFETIEAKLDKQISRSNSTLYVIVTIFLFIFGGSFMYTNRVADNQHLIEKQLDKNTNAVGIVISVLNDSCDNVVIDDLDSKYNPKRGKQ